MLKGLQPSPKAKGPPVNPPDVKLVRFHTVGKALFETTHNYQTSPLQENQPKLAAPCAKL